MSYCRVCGDEDGAQYIPSRRLSLCRSCASDTPRKVGFRSFVKALFGDEAESVGQQTQWDFYEDYLASTHTLEDYVATR